MSNIFFTLDVFMSPTYLVKRVIDDILEVSG